MKRAPSSSSQTRWGPISSARKLSIGSSHKNERAHHNTQDSDLMDVHHKHFEDELMGYRERKGLIGDSIERNMNQMIDVLRSKISAMGHAANNRIRLCEEDLKKNSKESSDQAPKIMEDFDESSNVRGARELRNSLNSHKDNLVSSEGVFIDAAHLVIRTKLPTEVAKKLELELEESCASSSLREMENLRGKISLSRTEKSKKVEQKRFEAKKILRNISEKDLQTNMENFLTRSVMDSDILFRAPSLPPIPGVIHKRRNSMHPSAMARAFEINRSNVSTISKDFEDCVVRQEEGDCKVTEAIDDRETGEGDSQHPDAVRWPIPIKWPQNDPRSSHIDNSEVT
jgi:hypothetical protein